MVSIPRIQRQQVPVANVPPAIQAPTQTAVGQGEQVLGAVLQDIGFRGIERQNRAAVTQAEAAARRTMLEAFNGNKDTPGLDQMQGPVYLEAAPRVLEGLDEQFKSINSALTPQQQAAFAPKLERIRTDAQTSVHGKAAKVSDQIAHAAYVNNLESLHETALYAADNVPFDPTTGEMDVSAVERVLGGDGSGRPGYGGADEAIKDYAYDNAHLLNEPVEEWVERAQTEFRSQIHSQAIQNALQDGDPDGARRYFKKVRDDMLGPDVELAETDVGKATAIMDAEAVARESLSSRPPLLTRNKAEEAARLGTTYTSESARYAEGLADAIEEGGPRAGEAFKAAYKEQQDQIKRAYSEQLSDTTELLRDVNYDFDELMKRDGARMNELYSAKDVAALEKLAKTEREGVQEDAAQAVLQRLARESLEDPVGYLDKSRSEKLALLAEMGTKHYEAWESKYAQDQKAGSVAPEVRSLIAGLADGAELDETREARLGLMATQIKADFEQGGTPMPLDKQRQVAENLVLEEVYIHGLSVNTEDPIFEATPDQLYDDLALFPELEDRMRAELVAAGVQNPTQDDAARLLLSKLALYGTQTADGAGGLGPLPVRDGGRTDAQIADEVLGGLSSEQFAQRLSGAAGAAAERTALTEAEIKRETAFLRARDPDDLARVARRAVGVGLTGDTRPAKLAKRIQDGTATEEDVRALLKASSELDFEDAEQRAADRRSLLPTVADDLIAEDPAMAAVLERIREASITSKAYKLGDPYQELFRVPKEDLTPAQLRRVEALIVRYSQP